MKSARQTAFEILLKIQKDSAFSNLVLDNMLSDNNDLDERDKAFVTNLVYGSLDRFILLDYNVKLYLNKASKKLRPELHVILIMGAYQILFMDKVPDHAAVSESVQLAKENKSAFAASLVNAVLRRVAENGLRYPDEDENSIEYVSVRYSCPEWLIQLWSDAYGLETAKAIAGKALETPQVSIRANTDKIDSEALMWKLAEEGVVGKHCDFLPDALELSNTGSVEQLTAFKDGLFHVQDLSSQICCEAVDVKPGETVFDLCSAPGGKAFTLAEKLKGTGQVKAFDVYQSRTDLIRKGAARLGLRNITVDLSDASVYNKNYGLADRVLCDVPCSGLGMIRRKPEIRFKNACETEGIPEIQYKILCNAVNYLKPGGRLVYSTCTLNPAENEEVCERFLSEHSDFRVADYCSNIPRANKNDKFLTLMPHIHGTDGFFVAAFERK